MFQYWGWIFRAAIVQKIPLAFVLFKCLGDVFPLHKNQQDCILYFVCILKLLGLKCQRIHLNPTPVCLWALFKQPWIKKTWNMELLMDQPEPDCPRKNLCVQPSQLKPHSFLGQGHAVDLVWDGSVSGGTKEAASPSSTVRGQHLPNVTHTLSV